MSQLERNQIVLIGKDVTYNATNLGDLENGEICVLDESGALLTAGDTIDDSSYITIVQGGATLGDPYFSQKITGLNVKHWKGASGVAAAEQVTFIGDNGTTGAILPVTSNTKYSMHIVFKHDKVIGSEHQMRRSFEYTTDSSATAAEIMNAFVALINADKFCKKYLVASTQTGGGNEGITLTGLAQTYNKNFGYVQPRFEITLDAGFSTATRIDEFGYVFLNGATPTTTGSTSVAPNPGVGTYALVADMENFALGNRGLSNRTGFPTPTGLELQADSTKLYDMYTIDHDDVHASANLNGQIASPLNTVIAIPYNTATAGASLEALLNPWFASCPGTFTALSL